LVAEPPTPESVDPASGAFADSGHDGHEALEGETNGHVPPAPWSDVTLPPAHGRDAYRVPSEKVTVQTDPSILPEAPRESRGLFGIVSPIARRALELGLASREPSFHVFVAAEPAVMVEDEIVRYAERFARAKDPPPDIVYVHDFDRPEAPRPLVLPAGVGAVLVEAMEAVINRLDEEIPSAVTGDAMQKAQATLSRDLEAKNKTVLQQLETRAKNLGFGVRPIDGGVQTFPILHGKPLSAEQFDVLDESTKRALNDAEAHLAKEVEKAAEVVREHTTSFEEVRNEALSHAAHVVIETTMQTLHEGFAEYGEPLKAYLARVEKALKDDWDDFVLEPEEGTEDGSAPDSDPEHATRLNRFRVNLFVSHDAEAHAPVIYETNPTYPNLFGHMERRARYGALLTDFTRVRAGSLQRASGGVLLVRAADLLADPIIWERMKRVLRERQIGAEDPLGPLGLYATSLRPVPVPISVRVVLVGPMALYAALLEADPDFAALFRVKVEVEPIIPRTPESLVLLDAYLMSKAKEREWGSFDRGGRARLLDLATRLAEHREKLALVMSPLEETAAFASALAAGRAVEELDGAPASIRTDQGMYPLSASRPPPETSSVTAEDVEQAWRERRERMGAAERHVREITLRGEVALDTAGARIGVVNGLSVYSAGDVEFGQPMRITAVVALGREGIIDVEREAQLGGSIHTKGVAILRGYLGRLFGQERPLSLRAQIAFEQSYGEIDGDSASSSELFSVLSALAEVPIDQGIAVTGSVNQLGEMQTIGGVCAKIEGFFDLCVARGLSGQQGVLLPRANVPHLVLREDVVVAIQKGQFHLYSVQYVHEGIEILTGLAAGERDSSGRFPAASVFGRVERRLIEIAERLREAEGGGHHLHHASAEVDDSGSTEIGDSSDFRGPHRR
jgi:predicted ATP-dependent protease